MTKTVATHTLSKTLAALSPEARAFWSKTSKGPQGQPSPYSCALSLTGKVGDLQTTLITLWADLGFPY